jgi:uncharacterized protein (TIGR03437 family)
MRFGPAFKVIGITLFVTAIFISYSVNQIQLMPLLATSAYSIDVITDLGTLGGVTSRAYGINASGQVVGFSNTVEGKMHAFLWNGTALRDLGTLPGSSESFGYAINDLGQIVGSSSNLGSVKPRAFLWQNNQMTDIGEFSPRAINKNGDIAGSLQVKRNNIEWNEHACLRRNGTLTDLGTLGGNFSYAYSINDAAQVVGISGTRDDASTRAVLWNNGAITDLGTLGGLNSQAYAIGNGGQVVGFAGLPDELPHAALFTLNGSGGIASKTDIGALSGGYSYGYAANSNGQIVGTNGHAVIWQNGMLSDLNDALPPDSGWVLEAATAINDKGQITGWGKYNGFTHAFLLGRVTTTVVTAVSAASYGSTLAPSAICSAFGAQLATETQAANTTPLPTALAGTSLMIRDSEGVERLAPSFFVSPTQVNFQVPPEVATGKASIAVTSGDNTISFGAVNIAKVAPGIFTANSSGRGLAAAVVLRITANGTQSYEAMTRFDSASGQIVAVPIDLGASTDQVFLLLFGTGMSNIGNSTPNVGIGGINAPVIYVGAQGSFVGLDQINISLPKSLAGRGEVELSLSIDGNTANPVKVNFR